MKNFLLFSTTFLLLTVCVHADQVITLKDGTQLRGELISVVNGLYTVQTTTIGKVEINAHQVASVSTNDSGNVIHASNAPSAPISIDQKIQNTQSQIMTNPALLADIENMAKDPEIMKLLSDPALIQSATSHDVNGMSSNPNTQQLLNNPKIKALIEKLQAGDSK